MGLLLNPIQERLLKGRQSQEEVLRFPKFRLSVAKDTTRFNQILWIQGTTAVVTLITTCPPILAVRACTLDIAIGQEALTTSTIGQQGSIGVNIALFQQRCEDFLDDPLVVFGVGSGKQIE